MRMRWVSYLASVFFVCAGMHASAWAQDPGATALRSGVVSKVWYVVYDVDKRGRVTQTVELQQKIVQAQALESMQTFGFSFDASMQRAEIVTAYTLKEDGRKLAVAPRSFQKTLSPVQAAASPAVANLTNLSVVFPPLVVGDTVGVVYKIVDQEPVFLGHFSLVQTLSPYTFYEDVRFFLRVPREMHLQMETHQLVQLPVVVERNTRIFQWRYQNKQPVAKNEKDIGIQRIDESPSFIVSTLNDYRVLAEAYSARVQPQLEPTHRLREMVHAIVGRNTQGIARVRLLYEWVSRNIAYTGNEINTGIVAAKNLDILLQNRTGDSQDHAILLQAMLAAVGVASEPVLINPAGLYDLPKTPALPLLGHVISYLPQYQLYLDASTKDIPFGYLPANLYGKPALHAGRRPMVARMPEPQHEKAQQHLVMKMHIAHNGSASGELRVALGGLQAASARAYMRAMQPAEEKNFVERALAVYGWRGHGTLKKGDSTGMTDDYQFSLTFHISNFLPGGRSGALVLAPVVATPMAVMNFADMKNPRGLKRRQRCDGLHSYETYDITLGRGLQLTSLPSDVTLQSLLLDFKAHYRRTVNGISVARELHDKTSTSVCTPEVMETLYQRAQPVIQNLRTQVLYQR